MIVVSSLVLNSPPICADFSDTSVKCVLASATTLSLRPPPQYHRVRFLPFLVPPLPEPEVPHAAVIAGGGGGQRGGLQKSSA